MPYCPKCDMEFVEGVTVCTDCGGPLVSSREEYERMKQEEELAAMEALRQAFQDNENGSEDDAGSAIPTPVLRRRAMPREEVYVSKADRCEDYSSSAAAFIIVGVAAVAVAVLGFAHIIPLPFYGAFRTVMLVITALLGAACLAVSFHSFRTAKVMKAEAAEEKAATDGMINWFIENHTAASLDDEINDETRGGLKPEERTLKRLSLIQDILITNYDIPDQAYVDELAEDIYDRMFDD